MVAHEKKVVHDACAVAAMLVAGNTLLSPSDKRQDARKSFFKIFQNFQNFRNFLKFFPQRWRERCFGRVWAII
jgi:hypothetical protein